MTDPRGVILHPLLEETLKSASDCLSKAEDGQLVWIIGPSGVGKSELRYMLMRQLSGKPSSWGAGRIPAVTVRAALTDRNKFNPKDLNFRLAMSLRSPNLSWLVPRGSVPSPDVVHFQSEVLAASEKWRELRIARTEHELREEFERNAPLRQVKWVFIEEIASLLKVHRNHSVENYMQSMMQMAEEAKVKLVLIGTHRAAPLWTLYEEVRRRSQWIWMGRYNETNKSHHIPFASMVSTIGRQFKLDKPDLLLQHLDLALLNSAGIFGEVQQWLQRSDQARCRDKKSAISLAHLQRGSYTQQQQIGMWGHARAFDTLANDPPGLDLSIVAKTRWGKHV